MGWLKVCSREIEVRGKPHTMEWIEFPAVVAVLPFTADGMIVLVEQYRPAVDRRTLEIPAGACKPGEDAPAAAGRELAEETGYRAGHLAPLGSFYPAIGYSSERIDLFIATRLEPGETNFDEGEDIVVHVKTPAEVAALVDRGGICDSKSILAFLLWRLKTGV